MFSLYHVSVIQLWIISECLLMLQNILYMGLSTLFSEGRTDEILYRSVKL